MPDTKRITTRQVWGRLDQIERDYKFLRKDLDDVLKLSVTTQAQVNNIHTCLAGNEDERLNGGGGLVKDVRELKKCNTDFVKFMERSKVKEKWFIGIASTVIGGLWALFIARWNSIFR